MVFYIFKCTLLNSPCSLSSSGYIQTCIKAPKTILNLSWQTLGVKFCLFQLVFCMFMFICFIFHSLFQKEIIATLNQLACIIIALLKYIYCLKFLLESWDVIFTRPLLKKWWDTVVWVLSLDQWRLFQWRLGCQFLTPPLTVVKL